VFWFLYEDIVMGDLEDIETILDDYFDEMVDDSELDKIKSLPTKIKKELEE
jgi:glutathionyl-hydroquinone reductase